MSLKRNILANYVGQFYGVLVGLVMVPIYVRYMGVEAYGLIGFFTTLQIWFQLLDIGLTPALAREAARLVSNIDVEAFKLRVLVRLLEIIFVCIALAGSGVLIVESGYIAKMWLKVKQLPPQEVQLSISLMAVNVGVRWISGLYRGALTGLERMVWLNGLNMFLATARFLLVIFVFIFIGTGPVVFFEYQLIITVLELGLLVKKTYRLMPQGGRDDHVGWQWEPLRQVFKFSMAIAIANVVLVMTMQADKLLLSKLLPLDEYAYFSLANLMASGIFMLSNPFGIALLPRLIKVAKGDFHGELRALYRESTQLVAVIVIPAVMILSFFAEQILWVWTGNLDLAHKVAPVLTLYALGNGFAAMGTFPYYLQFARGNLRLHIIGTVLLLITLIPAILWAVGHFGVVGAGYAWLGVNAIYFLFWLPYVHERLEGSLHTKWLLQDIGAIFFPCLIVATLIYYWFDWPQARVVDGMCAIGVCIILMIVATASSSQMRNKLLAKWRIALG